MEVSTVPFQQYAPFFKPEELDTLTAAFEATWQELSASGLDLSSEDNIALLKRKLAQRILVWRPRRGNDERAGDAKPRRRRLSRW